MYQSFSSQALVASLFSPTHFRLISYLLYIIFNIQKRASAQRSSSSQTPLDSCHRKVSDGQTGQQKPGVARLTPRRLGTPPSGFSSQRTSLPRELPPQWSFQSVLSAAPLIPASRVQDAFAGPSVPCPSLYNFEFQSFQGAALSSTTLMVKRENDEQRRTENFIRSAPS